MSVQATLQAAVLPLLSDEQLAALRGLLTRDSGIFCRRAAVVETEDGLPLRVCLLGWCCWVRQGDRATGTSVRQGFLDMAHYINERCGRPAATDLMRWWDYSPTAVTELITEVDLAIRSRDSSSPRP